MRKNLSEELEINDDVTIDNGEEKKPEEEKEGDDLKKDIQKDLDEKNKIADEIRNAEAPKATANDGFGKATKIKQFVESHRLTLEEPSDTLNEDLEDDYSDARRDAVYAFYDAISNYGYVLQTQHNYTGKKLEYELYSAFEEALFRFMMGGDDLG